MLHGFQGGQVVRNFKLLPANHANVANQYVAFPSRTFAWFAGKK